MIQNYSDNCDYLRKRFELRNDINLYELVNIVTEYIKSQDEKEEISKLTKEISQEKPKEKKRGRPRTTKSSSN